eukprot:scaffold35423_cov35-Prasinocladus_malaysianus.AAC.3
MGFAMMKVVIHIFYICLDMRFDMGFSSRSSAYKPWQLCGSRLIMRFYMWDFSHQPIVPGCRGRLHSSEWLRSAAGVWEFIPGSTLAPSWPSCTGHYSIWGSRGRRWRPTVSG